MPIKDDVNNNGSRVAGPTINDKGSKKNTINKILNFLSKLI